MPEYTRADLAQNRAIREIRADVTALKIAIVAMQASFVKNDLLARVEALEKAAATPPTG